MLGRSALGTCQLASLVLGSVNSGEALISASRYAPRQTLTRLFSSQSSMMEDRIFASDDLVVYHIGGPVDSTQDEVKRLLNVGDNKDKRAVALIADIQSNGRGTGGRAWHASDGNLYLTCAIATDMIPVSKLTLLPLAVGVSIAELIWKTLRSETKANQSTIDNDNVSQGSQDSPIRPVVKWPNDVLLDGRKVAGTLIENYCIEQKCWWLVGVGINMESYPCTLPPEQNDFRKVPRTATCVREHVRIESIMPTAAEFGVDLACQLMKISHDFRLGKSSTNVEMWKGWADMGCTYELRETGEKVVTLGLEADGQLRVKGGDGKERLLLADYLF